MAPVAAAANPANEVDLTHLRADTNNKDDTYPRKPLQLSGILDQYKFNDVTPVIGREYPTIQIKELLDAPNSDDLIRELAIVSEYAPPSLFIS